MIPFVSFHMGGGSLGWILKTQVQLEPGVCSLNFCFSLCPPSLFIYCVEEDKADLLLVYSSPPSAAKNKRLVP